MPSLKSGCPADTLPKPADKPPWWFGRLVEVMLGGYPIELPELPAEGGECPVIWFRVGTIRPGGEGMEAAVEE